MALIRLLWKSAGVIRWQFLMLAFLSAASNSGVLMLISAAAQKTSSSFGALRNVVLFGLAIAIFVMSQRRMMSEISSRIESLIDQIRKGLLERARAAEVLQVDEVGRSDLYNALSGSTQVISQVIPNIVIASQSFILVIITTIYIFTISPLAFLMWFLIITAMIAISIYRGAKSKSMLAEVNGQEIALMSEFADLFDGYRELKVSSLKMEELSKDIVRSSESARDKKIAFQFLFAQDYTVGTTMFYVMAGLMAFVVPVLTKSDSHMSTSLTMASLFMLGPVGNVAFSASLLQQANAAASQIEEFETKLSPAQAEDRPLEQLGNFKDFERLSLRNITFRYQKQNDDRSFSVGPIDLDLERGEVLFITGGNGSGKSTFISLLLDLYPPTGGGIWVDDQPIGPSNRVAYRDLFAVIFSNNHLFSRLYGLPTFSDAEAKSLISLLELDGKVSIVDGRFSTTKLSSGQRKRLSLITAILEKKQIYIFDEWAADQDPHFRAKFYNEIIPLLKQNGSTVLAVTHDEKYFHCSDRRMVMNDGVLCRID